MLSLFAERKAAEALVEARDLATFRNLARAASPRRVDLGVDVEVDRVAFLAPGRADLELGAVGHFDVDHVVVGMDTGLHLIFPWVSRWFPTSDSKLSGASTGRAPKLQPRVRSSELSVGHRNPRDQQLGDAEAAEQQGRVEKIAGKRILEERDGGDIAGRKPCPAMRVHAAKRPGSEIADQEEGD